MQWIKGLIIRPQNIKLLEENRGKALDIGLVNEFSDMTLKYKQQRQK